MVLVGQWVRAHDDITAIDDVIMCSREWVCVDKGRANHFIK